MNTLIYSMGTRLMISYNHSTFQTKMWKGTTQLKKSLMLTSWRNNMLYLNVQSSTVANNSMESQLTTLSHFQLGGCLYKLTSVIQWTPKHLWISDRPQKSRPVNFWEWCCDNYIVSLLMELSIGNEKCSLPLCVYVVGFSKSSYIYLSFSYSILKQH